MKPKFTVYKGEKAETQQKQDDGVRSAQENHPKLRVIEGWVKKRVDPGLLKVETLIDVLTHSYPGICYMESRCREYGIDTCVLEERLNCESVDKDYFEQLREYLVAIEICLNLGEKTGENVTLLHPDRNLAGKAMEYARKINTASENDYNIKYYTYSKINSFRSFVESKI